MNKIFRFSTIIFAGFGLFLFFTYSRDFNFSGDLQPSAELVAVQTAPAPAPKPNPYSDIEPQPPLDSPPAIIKAIYATGWTAGSEKGITRLINLINETEVNAIVIDIKDYSGELSYPTALEDVEKYGAKRDLKILRPNALIKKLHDNGIYVIARQTVFQDPTLALGRPDLALTSSSTGKQWKDYKGVMWMDTAAQEVWDYNIEIARDALARGFDEVNFDYIRFASDGNMKDVVYPAWNKKTSKSETVRRFFQYLREHLGDARLSADLFGYTTLLYDDLGIGQIIENAYIYFDYVAPMVYPSHYNSGFLGYKNPAEKPYEVVFESMYTAYQRLEHLKNASTTQTVRGQLRPWLQDFDMGATYDATKVRAQITATYKSASSTPIGWMLWAPSNVYTRAALLTDN
ncbi:MAG: putative glycoside hydrolase [bacterium]|nr:putative glycoside hydrolase [bacterium]